MVIEAAIKNYLSTYSGLTSLISKRIFYDQVPQGAIFPAISISLISGMDDETLSSDSNSADDSIQVTIWAKTREETIKIAKQVRLAFNGFSGIMGGSGGTKVSGINHEGTVDRVDDISGTFVYSRNMTYGFLYEKE